MHTTTLSSPHLCKHISSPSENYYQVLLLLHYTTLITGFLPLPGCQLFAAALLSSCLSVLYWKVVLVFINNKWNSQAESLLYMPKQNTAFCLLILLCTPFSTVFLLSAVDLLGMLGKHIKGQKFPLFSQEPNLMHFWSMAAVVCAHPISFFSLWGCARSWFCVWLYYECLSHTFSTLCSNASRHMEQG